MFLNSYSERTKCPACKAKIRLEDVRFTPTFSCPACQEEIQVSPLYLRTLWIASSALALAHCLYPRGPYPRAGQILVGDGVVGAVIVDTVRRDIDQHLSFSVGVHCEVLVSPKASTARLRPRSSKPLSGPRPRAEAIKAPGPTTN